MPTDSATAELHVLVDRLPPDAQEVARRVLSALVAQGEFDEEPLTPAEEADAEEGWQAYLRGEGKPLGEVRRNLAGK